MINPSGHCTLHIQIRTGKASPPIYPQFRHLESTLVEYPLPVLPIQAASTLTMISQVISIPPPGVPRRELETVARGSPDRFWPAPVTWPLNLHLRHLPHNSYSLVHQIPQIFEIGLLDVHFLRIRVRQSRSFSHSTGPPLSELDLPYLTLPSCHRSINRPNMQFCSHLFSLASHIAPLDSFSAADICCRFTRQIVGLPSPLRYNRSS